jgi:hypothetical protein
LKIPGKGAFGTDNIDAEWKKAKPVKHRNNAQRPIHLNKLKNEITVLLLRYAEHVPWLKTLVGKNWTISQSTWLQNS